jgi:nucleotide-binding universal stress UspA family protein
VFVFDSLELGRESVEKFVRSIDADIEYTVTAVEGPPARVLLEVAEQVKADLIVVGNVRMQGLGRVLGSVGNEVLRSAPCSVLIVKTV